MPRDQFRNQRGEHQARKPHVQDQAAAKKSTDDWPSVGSSSNHNPGKPAVKVLLKRRDDAASGPSVVTNNDSVPKILQKPATGAEYPHRDPGQRPNQADRFRPVDRNSSKDQTRGQRGLTFNQRNNNATDFRPPATRSETVSPVAGTSNSRKPAVMILKRSEDDVIAKVEPQAGSSILKPVPRMIFTPSVPPSFDHQSTAVYAQLSDLSLEAKKQQRQTESLTPICECTKLPTKLTKLYAVPPNENRPMKLIDWRSWNFNNSTEPSSVQWNEILNSDGFTSFNVIAAIGQHGVGKSSLLNKLAGSQVFPTGRLPDHLLQAVTHGLELYITPQSRLFLIDTQPLLSPFLTEEFQKTPSGQSGSASFMDLSLYESTSYYPYITSLQMICFLLAACDHVILVTSWFIDPHLLKIVSEAMNLLLQHYPTMTRGQLLLYCPHTSEPSPGRLAQFKSVERLFPFGAVRVIYSEEDLIRLVSRKPARTAQPAPFGVTTEKMWHSLAARFWEVSIRPSRLYMDIISKMI